MVESVTAVRNNIRSTNVSVVKMTRTGRAGSSRMVEIELEPENEEEEEEEEDVLQTIRSYCRFTCYHPHW